MSIRFFHQPIFLANIFFGLFVLLIVTLTFKGNKQTFNNSVFQESTEVGSVFESSNTTSRYALTSAIVNDSSFFFNLRLARFAAPDIVNVDGKFFTIFTPGISFFAIPFFWWGQQLGGYQHVTTFFSTILFAICNVFLIVHISRRLHASILGSFVGGLVFIFATNAFGYIFTLTQHHGSVTVILLAVINAMSTKRQWLNNILFGILCGIGLLFDVPNLFMMAPIGLYILFQHFSVKEYINKVIFFIKPSFILITVGILPLFALFIWYNSVVTGTPTKLDKMFPRSDYFDTRERQELNRRRENTVDPFAEKLPFSTRAQLKGFYTLLISDERAWWYYSPVVFLGLFGIWNALQNKEIKVWTVLLGTVLCLNILMYSMFGDPWGGWSFGPRYLIPGAAILSIFVGTAATQFAKNIFFTVIFAVLVLYSVGINTSGALTTLTLPPKVEAQFLGTIPHTFIYNFQLLQDNKITSFYYNTLFFNSFTPYQYWMGLTSFISGTILLIFLLQRVSHRGHK